MGDFPNKDTQFKKGHDRPGPGRPEGRRNVQTVVREVLETVVNQKSAYTGRPEEKAIVDHLTDVLLKKSFVDEDTKAIDMLFDRADGKPQQDKTIKINSQYLEMIDELDEEADKE
jgi:hypothetical protein